MPISLKKSAIQLGTYEIKRELEEKRADHRCVPTTTGLGNGLLWGGRHSPWLGELAQGLNSYRINTG